MSAFRKLFPRARGSDEKYSKEAKNSQKITEPPRELESVSKPNRPTDESTKPPSIERNLIGIFTKFEPLQGHYGSIRKCMLRTGTSHKWIGWPLIAMKKIEIVKLNDNQVQVISKSICELLELRHEAFLRYYGIVMNRKNKISIVTDWLPEESVSLLSFHSKTDGLFTQWEETRSYSLLSLAKQICEGMAWVHDRGILHRNLTSTNVFLVPKQNIDARNISLGDRWNVKISDFGLKDLLIYENRVLEGELEKIPKTYKAVCWMAPEVLKAYQAGAMRTNFDTIYSRKSDIFSFGILFYELVCGQMLRSPAQTLLTLSVQHPLEISMFQMRDNMPYEIKELIYSTNCLNRDARIEFAQLIDNLGKLMNDFVDQLSKKHNSFRPNIFISQTPVAKIQSSRLPRREMFSKSQMAKNCCSSESL